MIKVDKSKKDSSLLFLIQWYKGNDNMGRLKDGKNIMRTPKEKEDIVLENLDVRISTRAIAAKYGTTQDVFNK